MPLALDVTDGAAARTVFAHAAEVLGGLDIACLNAGVSSMACVEDDASAGIKREIEP
jgi:NAD(P)-dependent dehydrogenase (short-subunit alcohol dehydrogenase family)